MPPFLPNGQLTSLFTIGANAVWRLIIAILLASNAIALLAHPGYSDEPAKARYAGHVGSLYFTVDSGFYTTPRWDIRMLPLSEDGWVAPNASIHVVASYAWCIRAFDVSPNERTLVYAGQGDVFVQNISPGMLGAKPLQTHRPTNQSTVLFSPNDVNCDYCDAVGIASDNVVYLSCRTAAQGPNLPTKIIRLVRNEKQEWKPDEKPIVSYPSDTETVRGIAAFSDHGIDYVFIAIGSRIDKVLVKNDVPEPVTTGFIQDNNESATIVYGAPRAVRHGTSKEYMLCVQRRMFPGKATIRVFNNITSNVAKELYTFDGTGTPGGPEGYVFPEVVESAIFGRSVFFVTTDVPKVGEPGVYLFPKMRGPATFEYPPTIRVATPTTGSYLPPRMTIRYVE